ncbi:hypothetical protein ACQPTN_10680 [Bradyrhizobium sp. 13971]
MTFFSISAQAFGTLAGLTGIGLTGSLFDGPDRVIGYSPTFLGQVDFPLSRIQRIFVTRDQAAGF